MRIFAKLAVGILALLGLFFVAGSLLLPSLIDCESVLLRTATSPNGQLRADVQSQTCKDSTDNGVYLFVGPVERRSGSIVKIADSTTTDFDIEWLWDGELEVLHSRNADLSNTPSSIADVRIRFRSR